MAVRTMKGLGYQLGLFSDYSNHGSEFSVKIKEKEQNQLEVFIPNDKLYMTIIGRDRKILFDNHDSAVLNIRNRTLNFGGEYQVFEGDADRLPLFTVRNKWSLGGHKMVTSFTNFDDKTVELQIQGKLLSSSGKIVLNDQPIARFEGGILEPIDSQPGKFETVSIMTVAPLVDVAMAVTLLVCLQDISSGD